MILIICTTANCYAKIKAFQASLLPDDVFFRKEAVTFAESRDCAGFVWYAFRRSLLRNGAVFMAISIHDSETAVRKAAAKAGQGLWHTVIDAAMRFTGTPITSGRVV